MKIRHITRALNRTIDRAITRVLDTVEHHARTYIFTPVTLAPGVVFLTVISTAVIVSSEPYDGLARASACVCLSFCGIAAGWMLRERRALHLSDLLDHAEMLVEVRTDACDTFQRTISELKHRINRLYTARDRRQEVTGRYQVVGQYRIYDEARVLP